MKRLFKQSLVAVILILVTGIAVYSNTFEVPFVLDDHNAIVNNIAVEKLNNVFYGYELGQQFIHNRFVAYLSFALNHHFGGLDVAGYHLVNLLVHLVTALLVYALLRLTFHTPFVLSCVPGPKNEGSSGRTPFSAPYVFVPLFAALIFVVHPVQTQAVTYIVQRMASMASLFYFLSLVLYVKARLRTEEAADWSRDVDGESGHAKRKGISFRSLQIFFYTGSVLAAILAMKTKEIAFTLPLVAVLYELFFFRGAWRRRLVYLLPLLATLPIIPLTQLGLLDFGVDETSEYAALQEPMRTGTSMSRLDYLLTQFRVIATYLRLMVVPVRQNLDYDYPVFTTFFTPPVFLSFLLLAAIFVLSLYLFFASRRSSGFPEASKPAFRLVSFGILWFFLTLSIESSIIPIKDIIMEHRLYLPFFGTATAFAVIFHLLVNRWAGAYGGKALMLGAAVLTLVLGVATYQRNHIWSDPVRLWQDVVAKSPNKARPINNLGKALEGSGKRAEAFKAFSKAIQLDPGYYKGYYNLADLYLVTDQPETALQLLDTAIRLNPDMTEAYVSVGAALMRAGRFRDVAVFLEKNLHRVEDKAEARFYLGAAYAFLGNREKALRELDVLSRLDPSYANNLAGMIGPKSSGHGPHGQQR